MKIQLFYDSDVPDSLIKEILKLNNHSLAQISKSEIFEFPMIFPEDQELEGSTTDSDIRGSKYTFIKRGKEDRLEASTIIYHLIDVQLEKNRAFKDMVGVITSRGLYQPVGIRKIGKGHKYHFSDIFGLHINNRGLIVSTFGLNANQVLKLWRHETAHIILDIEPSITIKNGHCTNSSCLFKPLYDQGDIDTVTNFCPDCWNVLSQYFP